MIVVVGRPGLGTGGELDRAAGQIALAAARGGGHVELVGSVGDDADGDDVVVRLGQAGIGHAAILRDAAGRTPREGDGAGNGDIDTSPLPRLDAGDIDLGLSYLPECRVLVAAEPLSDDAMRVVADAAAYHRAELVILGEARDAPEEATVLEVPTEDSRAFAELVARYAMALDDGRSASDAWQDAVDATGWEPAAE